MAIKKETGDAPGTSWNKRVFIVTSSLLVALMMACVMIAVLQLFRRINAGWQVTYLPWVGFFISLEAIYTTHLSNKISYFSEDRVKMRVAELIVILVIVKLLLFFIYSPMSLWFDLQAWKSFIIDFFNKSYLMAIGFTVFLWFMASQFGVELYEIGRDDYAKRQEVAYYFSEDRAIARRKLVNRILALGAIMVTIAAVVGMDMHFIWGDRALISGTYINLLLYFVIAFALFSLTQFAILGATWRQENTPVQRNVASRWVATSLVFLLGLAGLVWFLPTRYSLGLLSVLSLIFSYLGSIVFFLWNLFGFLFASLFRLLGHSEDQVQPPSDNFELPNLQTPPIIPVQPFPWVEALKSILFWSVLISVIGFALHQYLQQNQELWKTIRRLPLVSWLANLFKGLSHWFNRTWRSVVSGVEAVRKRLIPAQTNEEIPESWQFIRVHSLTPRQQVLFYFQALLRKAEQRGIRRQKAQTPYEYTQTLEASMPEVQTNLEPFADTFVEARYSLHPVTNEQASQAHQWWQSIRKVILRRRPAQKLNNK
jgi:Domain of unknown function (DUF4129)